MKQGINSVATLHESGFVHRSIGRSSFILSRLSSTSMDKREASLYDSTNTNQSSVKLTDFGFSGPYDRCTIDDAEFCTRARSFGLYFTPGEQISDITQSKV